MSRIIEIIKGYKIVQSSDEYIVANLAGEYENHGHFKKLSTCYLIIKLIESRIIPYSPYLMESARRLTTDPRYEQAILRRMGKRKEKQLYYNPIRKGGVR